MVTSSFFAALRYESEEGLGFFCVFDTKKVLIWFSIKTGRKEFSHSGNFLTCCNDFGDYGGFLRGFLVVLGICLVLRVQWDWVSERIGVKGPGWAENILGKINLTIIPGIEPIFSFPHITDSIKASQKSSGNKISFNHPNFNSKIHKKSTHLFPIVQQIADR